MVRATNITQKEPIQFRVEWVDLHLFGPNAPSDGLMVRIQPMGQPASTFFMSRATYEPYREAVAEAIASQAVYWVDWYFPEASALSPRRDDSPRDRLLQAIKNQQIVRTEEEEPVTGQRRDRSRPVNSPAADHDSRRAGP